MKRLLSTAIVLFAGVALAIPPRKVISAVRVDKGPLVDGDLSDEVWRKAECRSDFEDALSQPKPLSEGRSDLRLLTDGEWLYVGVRVKSTVKLPPMEDMEWKGEFTKKFKFNWCHEIFLDPMRTRTHHYQYVVRADRTCMAQYAGDWNGAKKNVKIATKRDGDVWTLEFAFPAKGQLEPGMEWGFDLTRNDEFPGHSGWYVFSGPSNTPQLFAPLLIGGYKEWFAAAFAKTQSRIVNYRKTFTKGFMAKQLDYCQAELDGLKGCHERGASPVSTYLRWTANESALNRVDDEQFLVGQGFPLERK